MKNKGINKSLYIKAETVGHCNELCRLGDENGQSFSELMDEAIKQAYFQKRTNVWISPGAYLAIANSQLEALECVRSRTGGINLMLKIEAPAMASLDDPDSTYPESNKSTIYSIGAMFLQRAEEPPKQNEKGVEYE